MRRLLRLAALSWALGAAAACSRGSRSPRAEEPLRGNAVWFADGLAEGDAAIEEALLSFRCAAAFVPARRLTGGAAGWSGSDLPAPAVPLRQVPVVLVIESPDDPLAGATEEQQKSLGGFLAREIASALTRGAEFGPVRGVHLDFPFAPASVEPLAAALARGPLPARRRAFAQGRRGRGVRARSGGDALAACARARGGRGEGRPARARVPHGRDRGLRLRRSQRRGSGFHRLAREAVVVRLRLPNDRNRSKRFWGRGRARSRIPARPVDGGPAQRLSSRGAVERGQGCRVRSQGHAADAASARSRSPRGTPSCSPSRRWRSSSPA